MWKNQTIEKKNCFPTGQISEAMVKFYRELNALKIANSGKLDKVLLEKRNNVHKIEVLRGQ